MPTGIIQPLVDLNAIEDILELVTPDEEGIVPAHRIPRGGVLMPDGKTWVYIGSSGPKAGGTIWSMNLPPGAETMTQLGTIDASPDPWSESHDSIASNGLALIWGYLLQFEQE